MYIDLFSGIYEKYNLGKCIRDAKRIGYDSVQIRCFGDEGLEVYNDSKVDEAKQVLNETGIKVSCLYSITGGYGGKEEKEYEEELKKLEWVCKAAEKLNAEYIMHMADIKYGAKEDMINKVVELYKKAANIAGKYNKKLVMEIHNGGYIQSVDGAKDLLRRIEIDKHLLQETEDKMEKANLFRDSGKTNFLLGEYEKAMLQFKEALKISEELRDKSGMATSLNNIGAIYKAWGDYESAFKIFEKALLIDKDLADRSGMATSLNNIGEIYRIRGDYNRSEEHTSELQSH